ncbi:uncharacterized protein [Nicotiana sylvestris]|uniref:Uncharacterized protein LOC104220429 n=1 Tax=Nicotiana sylvestris TaxID=4096 RepID=A0A1U7VTC5_NICSY|nr:PREDICTED: uncharacterized protein LOC104220429 [Nicotiana sylvestris]
MSTAIEGPIRDHMTEDTLAFSKEDLETLAEPYNDALVISFLLINIQIKRVLMDPGSSANVIRSKVVEQLGLLNQVVPASRVLNVFNIAGKIMKGEIILPVDVSGTIQNTKFHVIICDTRYNALLGRPWIHNMRAVPSTLHQMIKFPMKDGITTIYGERYMAKEMFTVYQEAPSPIHSTLDESRSIQTPEDDEEDFLAP